MNIYQLDKLRREECHSWLCFCFFKGDNLAVQKVVLTDLLNSFRRWFTTPSRARNRTLISLYIVKTLAEFNHEKTKISLF